MRLFSEVTWEGVAAVFLRAHDYNKKNSGDVKTVVSLSTVLRCSKVPLFFVCVLVKMVGFLKLKSHFYQ